MRKAKMARAKMAGPTDELLEDLDEISQGGAAGNSDEDTTSPGASDDSDEKKE